MHLLGYRIFPIYDRSYSEVSSKEVEPEPAMIESLRASSELRGLAKCPSLTAQKNTWRDLYLQAIFEPERTKIPFRIQEAERALIEATLRHTGYDKARAASMLGMHRQSLQHKLRELGLARRYVSIATDDDQLPDQPE